MPDPLDRLTPRQREIIGLACLGYPDSAIAAQLGLALCTVKTHLAHSREALGVVGLHRSVGRRWLLRFAYELGRQHGFAAGQQQTALAALRACLGEEVADAPAT